MAGTLLVLNAGSSSLKFALYDGAGGTPQVGYAGQIEGLHDRPRFVARDPATAATVEVALPAANGQGHAQAIDWLLAHLREAGRAFDAVGHRVVHGGMHYADAVRIDADVLAVLDTLVPLAPLHQPHNLAAIREIVALDPALPQVACFDTAFHRSNADLVQRYALPDALHQQGIRRYGFHGLSYAHIATVLADYDAGAAAGKTIVLHLGNGSSMCAIDRGISVTTSMGFSAVDGIPMATRCGSIDPGVILHLLTARGMDVAAVERLIYRESGLLGVSGLSGDMRVLSASGDPRAQLAIELYAYRIVREIGSLTAALGGLDALVFTAGIGENAANVRARILSQLAWLGVRLDGPANQRHGPRISAADSRVAAYVIRTNEELVIAQQAFAVLARTT